MASIFPTNISRHHVNHFKNRHCSIHHHVILPLIGIGMILLLGQSSSFAFMTTTQWPLTKTTTCSYYSNRRILRGTSSTSSSSSLSLSLSSYYHHCESSNKRAVYSSNIHGLNQLKALYSDDDLRLNHNSHVHHNHYYHHQGRRRGTKSFMIQKNLFIDDDDDEDDVSINMEGEESSNPLDSMDVDSLWLLEDDDDDETDDDDNDNNNNDDEENEFYNLQNIQNGDDDDDENYENDDENQQNNDDHDDDGGGSNRFEEMIFSLDKKSKQNDTPNIFSNEEYMKRKEVEGTKVEEEEVVVLLEDDTSGTQTNTATTATSTTSIPTSAQESIQKVHPISSSPKKTSQQQQQEVMNPPKPPRGVGRQGYNMTILHHINYDQKQYYDQFTKSSYDIRIDLLTDYHVIHGHINIPFRYSVNVDDYDTDGKISGSYEIHLGRWLHWIRTLYRKDEEKIKKYDNDPTSTIRRKVPLKYVEKLNNLGINWEGVGARRRPTNFREKCKELQQFIEMYGHSYVPKDWAENKSLAMWVERQRFLYKRRLEGRGKGNQLTDERIDLLKSMGFDFNGRSQGRNGNLMIGSPKGIGGKKDERLSSGWFESQIQSQFDKEWRKNLNLLRQYKSAHGHCTIDLSNIQIMMKDEEVWNLSYWMMDQQRQYRLLYGDDLKISAGYNATTVSVNLRSLLTPKRYQALSDLDYKFATDGVIVSPKMLPWQDIAEVDFDCEHMLGLLKSRKEQSGSCDISLDETIMAQMVFSSTFDKSSPQYEQVLLFLFQKRLRWEKRHQPMISKTPQIDWYLERKEYDLVARLNEIGFSWFDVEIPGKDHIWAREFEWWGNFHDLCRYKKANNGFALNPNENWYSEDLVDWLEEQKESYRILTLNEDNSEGEMFYFKEWHLQALYDVGFELNSKENIDESQHQLINGPNRVGRPPAILALENDLESKYIQLSSDLQQVANDSLNRKRIDKAEQLAWLVRYEALRRLYSSHGTGALSVLSTDKDVCDQRLLLWADNQRKQYTNFMKGKKSALTKTRIQLLDEINFDWEQPSEDEEWNQIIAALKKFKEEYGHCFVPAVYSKDAKLGRFVHLQRQVYQLSKRDDMIQVSLPSTLSFDRAKELMNIGLDLTMDNLSFGNIAYETVWKCKMEELQQFKKIHGHCDVVFDYKSPYYDLALWVKEQRILYKRFTEGISSQLDEKRIEELDELGFTWDDEILEVESKL